MPDQITFENLLEPLAPMALAGYSIALHLRFASALMTFRTYPQEWSDHYTANGYALRDPVVAWALTTNGVKRWSEMAMPDLFGVLKEAKKHGLNYGAASSFGPISSRSLGGMARADREFTDAELAIFDDVVRRLHLLSDSRITLSKPESTAITAAATGLLAEDAAKSLGITPAAYRKNLGSAETRLMARNTTEAIQRARDRGIV